MRGLGTSAEAYGKARIVGLDGIQHASALIHTLRFGTTPWDVTASTLLPADEKRGSAGVTFDIR
jgi:hypothetical protein